MIVLLCSVSCITIYAQTATTGAATAAGNCNIAVSGSGNTIRIQTCGMTKAQVEEWRSSFRQMLNKQIDPKVLVALLDDIKNGEIRIENGVLRIENKVAEIQEAERPRALTADQQKQLASRMKEFSGERISYDPRRDNDEVTGLVDSIRAALAPIGIQLQDAGNMITNGTPFPPPGISIIYAPDRADVAMALSGAFFEVGLPNTVVLNSNAQGLLRIRFGPKI